MIIFYNKQTGDIVGTIEGRIHTEQINPQHLKMWVGSKEENDRLVINWEFIEAETEEGGTGAGIWEASHPQKDLFADIERNPSRIREYKVNIDTKELVKK